MFVRETSYCAVVAFGVLIAGPHVPASAQNNADVSRSRAHVQSLLDQYAPGTVRLDPLAVTPSYATPAADADAARARAQAFLDQFTPNMITLGEKGVRVEIPGAAVVDTQTGTTTITKPAAAPATAVQPTALHRAAIDEALGSLRSGRYHRASLWLAAVTADLPRDADLRQLEALVLVGDGRWDEAGEAARIGLILAPAWNAEQLRNLVPAFEDLDRTLQERALQSNPDARTLFLAAYFDLMLGRQAQATRMLEKADALLPPGWITEEMRLRFASE